MYEIKGFIWMTWFRQRKIARDSARVEFGRQLISQCFALHEIGPPKLTLNADNM